MFRVLSAPIIRSSIKTADAIIGTVHVLVWFKSVERLPSSGVYFTMSWPNSHYNIAIGLLGNRVLNYRTLVRKHERACHSTRHQRNAIVPKYILTNKT
jgi:hypothetical protein